MRSLFGHLGSWLKAFGGFWYDFVVGDDWVSAAGVLVMLGAAYGLLRLGVPAYWAGPVVIVASLALLLVRAEQRDQKD